MTDPFYLCQLQDLEPTGAYGVTISLQAGKLDILLVTDAPTPGDRPGDWPTIRAYHNACPHIATPLETFEHEFIDRQDPTLLVCSTHGARFRIKDGHCVAGPCKRVSLTPLSITIRKNDIFLTQAEI